jgi:hypothetical protein
MTVTAPLAPKAWVLSELLGPDHIDEETTAHAVADLASQALGRDVPPQLPELIAIAYPFGSPATGALLRVRGHDAVGQPWSLFVKVLHHVRHWVQFPLLPPGVRRALRRRVSVACRASRMGARLYRSAAGRHAIAGAPSPR